MEKGALIHIKLKNSPLFFTLLQSSPDLTKGATESRARLTSQEQPNIPQSLLGRYLHSPSVPIPSPCGSPLWLNPQQINPGWCSLGHPQCLKPNGPCSSESSQQTEKSYLLTTGLVSFWGKKRKTGSSWQPVIPRTQIRDPRHENSSSRERSSLFVCLTSWR